MTAAILFKCSGAWCSAAAKAQEDVQIGQTDLNYVF